MRRIGLIVALGALLGMFGGVVTASPALADRGPKWVIAPAPDPLDLPITLQPSGEQGGDCGFRVRVTFPVNSQYLKTLKTDDSMTTFLVTGSLTASFTNLGTGKTITQNISGPSKVTAFPDGSAVVAFKGLTLFIITRDQAQQLGLPAVSVIAGGLTVSVNSDGIFTSVSPQRHVLVDICAALS
jgi:hypothetical protein